MSNKDAERLRIHLFNEHITGTHDCMDDLDAALAAERKATVERIRNAIEALDGEWFSMDNDSAVLFRHAESVDSILDAEAGPA